MRKACTFGSYRKLIESSKDEESLNDMIILGLKKVVNLVPLIGLEFLDLPEIVGEKPLSLLKNIEFRDEF
jgi:hypothetical protein